VLLTIVHGCGFFMAALEKARELTTLPPGFAHEAIAALVLGNRSAELGENSAGPHNHLI
jgi:hypothetical protein